MLKNTFLLLALTLAMALSAAGAAISFTTTFAPEAPGATGSGSGQYIFDTEAQTLFIDVNWIGLGGTTSVAHIHCCVTTAGDGTIGVAVTPSTLPGFPVGTNAGSYSITLNLAATGTYTASFLNNFGGGTVEGASAALLQGMLDGKAYFNIHTNTFPAGEIRGFLTEVPEPGTWLLSMVALLGMGSKALLRRRAGGVGA